MTQTQLPPPDSDALQHSVALLEHIRERINSNGGHISFAQYMELALYTPGLGYYSGGSTKFGAAGDFTTAPELSPLFGACVAHQCARVLEQVAAGNILEFGAGSGRLAAQVLLTLEHLACLPERYFILEVSAELRQRQQQSLEQLCPSLVGRVQWLEQLPQDFRGVVLANEVIDAMPVHRVQKHQGQWFEMEVNCDDQGALGWTRGAPVVPSLLHDLAPWDEELAEGYTTELNAAAAAWLQGLAQAIDQAVVLIIDYGFPAREYYHPQRQQGTLMCHYRHHSHGDPFYYPGLQDITAHVNFTALATSAETAGLSLLAYTSQAWFLMANGLEQELQAINDEHEFLRASQAVKLLTLPHEMGELFKVMALGKGFATPPQGFDWHDMRGRL